jgi:Family of unknown function (DUF5989)
MRPIRDAGRLFADFVAFAHAKGVYWIIPLVIMLGLVGLLVVAGQAAGPLIYTLF